MESEWWVLWFSRKMHKFIFLTRILSHQCLVCCESVNVINKKNIIQHYETKHTFKSETIQGHLHFNKVWVLTRELQSQQLVFHKQNVGNEATVKVNFMTPGKITFRSACFNDVKFVEECYVHPKSIYSPVLVYRYCSPGQ